MGKEKIIFGILCTLVVQSISVSGQSVRYSNFYDSNMGAEILDEAVVLDDGTMMVAGKTSNSNGSGFGKVFNQVLNEDGSLQYSHVWAENQVTIGPYAIVRTESGAIYEAGTRHDYSVSSLGTGDFFLARLDETGDTLFTKIYERKDTCDLLLDMVQTRPNKIMLIGWTCNDSTQNNTELMFITVDTLGNEVNRVVWGGGGTDYARANALAKNGHMLISGYTASFAGSDNDTWLIYTDSIGNVIWSQTYNHLSPSGGDAGSAILNLNDTAYIVAGSFELGTSGVTDNYIMKVDTLGNELWTKRLEIPEHQGFWPDSYWRMEICCLQAKPPTPQTPAKQGGL